MSMSVNLFPILFFFFFKQKTAYEILRSDWSSDVCSSDLGMPHVALAHDPQGRIDTDALIAQARAFEGIEGADLAAEVSGAQTMQWSEGLWHWPRGFAPAGQPRHRVVAIDYGAKRNILRHLVAAGAAVTVLPATATAADVAAHQPDGVFLSNGPGDPAATAEYASPM